MEANTTYEVKVAAVNGKGQGEYSKIEIFQTLPVRKYNTIELYECLIHWFTILGTCMLYTVVKIIFKGTLQEKLQYCVMPSASHVIAYQALYSVQVLDL